MAASGKGVETSQCSLCHFYKDSRKRHSELGRLCRAKETFVQGTDPICTHFSIAQTQWCPKKEQPIPLVSCLGKQRNMRNNVEEKRWMWRRCINCVHGVLLFKLNEVSNENKLRLLRRTGSKTDGHND